VRAIIDHEYDRVRKILENNRDKLDLIAKTLLEVETLEAHEFVALLEGEDLPAKPSVPQTDRSEPAQTKPDADAEWKKPPSLDLPPSPSPA
jgi:cell division protease FtsH